MCNNCCLGGLCKCAAVCSRFVTHFCGVGMIMCAAWFSESLKTTVFAAFFQSFFLSFLPSLFMSSLPAFFIALSCVKVFIGCKFGFHKKLICKPTFFFQADFGFCCVVVLNLCVISFLKQIFGLCFKFHVRFIGCCLITCHLYCDIYIYI